MSVPINFFTDWKFEPWTFLYFLFILGLFLFLYKHDVELLSKNVYECRRAQYPSHWINGTAIRLNMSAIVGDTIYYPIPSTDGAIWR